MIPYDEKCYFWRCGLWLFLTFNGVRMSRLKIVRCWQDDGNGVSQIFLEKCHVFLLCYWVLASMACIGIQSVSPVEPQNSYYDSGGPKVGRVFVVGVQLPPTPLSLVMLLLGSLAFCNFLLHGRTVAYPSCPLLLINSNTVDISGQQKVMVILQPTRHVKMFSDCCLGCSNTWSLHWRIRHCPELQQVEGSPSAKYCAENVGPAAIRAGLPHRVVPSAIGDKGHKIDMRRGTLVAAVRGKDSNYNWNCKWAPLD